MAKTWFITGVSRGFGREWAEAALARGDAVAATARDMSTLDELVEKYGDRVLPIQLDVNDHDADFAAVKQAFDRFETIDVIVNNAGYGHFGMIEEASEEEARGQLETNLFGALWVTQAALPYLRKQGHGHIIQVSSIGGVAAFPGIGLYHASKWGLEGFSEALSKEVAQFGIFVTIIEPGGYSTDWSGDSAKHANTIAAYDNVREERTKAREASGIAPGEPTATADAIMKIVDSDKPPLRLILGKYGQQLLPEVYHTRLKEWADWKGVSETAQGN